MYIDSHLLHVNLHYLHIINISLGYFKNLVTSKNYSKLHLMNKIYRSTSSLPSLYIFTFTVFSFFFSVKFCQAESILDIENYIRELKEKINKPNERTYTPKTTPLCMVLLFANNYSNH